MRIMAFDYGIKRVGVAVTDPMRLIASTLGTFSSLTILDFVEQYLQTETVVQFVVGKPLRLDGLDSESASHVRGFISRLTIKFPDIPVAQIDERFTSKIATSIINKSGLSKKKRQNKALVDSIAATIILQDYLNSRLF